MKAHVHAACSCVRPRNPGAGGVIPWGQRKHIRTLDFGPPQQRLFQNLCLQQPHGLPPTSHVPILLDGVGHVLVPPAVVHQGGMTAATMDCEPLSLSVCYARQSSAYLLSTRQRFDMQGPLRGAHWVHWYKRIVQAGHVCNLTQGQ